MKKGVWAVALILAFAVSAFAADTIKIGGMLPLSGRAADLGITCKQGAELAVKEINDKGGVLGKKLELLMADDKANVQESVSLANRYIQKDNVNFLFGQVSSAAILAVAEVAKQEKVIFMATVASTDTSTKEKWNRYTFRSGTCNSQEANSLALYAVQGQESNEVLQHRSRLRIRPDHVGAVQDQELGTEPEGGIHRRTVAQTLFRRLHSYINAILGAKPDAVFCTLWGGDLVAFIKQAKPSGSSTRSNGSSPPGGTSPSPKCWEKRCPTGLIVDQRYYFHWPETPRNQEFVKAYIAAYNDYPSAWAVEGYDGIYFLARESKSRLVGHGKDDTALEGLTIDSPSGKATLRKEDHQLLCDFMVGETFFDKAYPFAIVGKPEVFPGDKVLYTLEEWKKAQAGNQ